MGYLALAIVVVAVFGICFLVDKGFTKLFRNRQEHHTGLSVRHDKKVITFGVILLVLGIAALIFGNGLLYYIGSGVLCLVGVFLIVLYTTFGIYYGEDSFLLSTFRRKNVSYAYKDIQAQQLYNNAGTIMIELHMADGTAIQLQSSMVGVYPFLDKAFEAWLRQTDRKKEDCEFYDPENSRWFPETEE